MPDPWVFVPELDAAVGQPLPLEPDVQHHLGTVLRLRPGAPLIVSDGRGRHADAVHRGDHVELAGEVTVDPEPATAIWVLQALPKARKFDDVVRVLTELGVDRITAVAAERSVAVLVGSKAERARERWQSVARAAAEQSRRSRLPVVDGPSSVAEAAAETGHGLVAHVGAQTSLTEALTDLGDPGDRVRIAIGPEGGWSPDEVTAWSGGGLRPVHLGPSVLRTEHAGTVVAAVVAGRLGRF